MMNNISLAPGVSRVAPSQIRAIADVAFPMDGVLKLHFGESNKQTPQYPVFFQKLLHDRLAPGMGGLPQRSCQKVDPAQ
jgi:hypothetical protein